MNYSELLREFCLKNKGKIIEIAQHKDKDFAHIPYKTLLKILTRLEDEGMIYSIAKGIYYLGAGKLTEKKVIKTFTEKESGMVGGYDLFNILGLTNHRDEIIEIYTNKIKTKQKTIGRIKLIYLNLIFNDKTKDMLALLETLEKGFSIKSCNLLTYQKIVRLLAHTYDEEIFNNLIKSKKYKYSTINKLSEILENQGICNRCLELYNEVR